MIDSVDFVLVCDDGVVISGCLLNGVKFLQLMVLEVFFKS